MRAVLDTVIFVRALISPRGRWGRLVIDFSDRYIIVLSSEIISEIVAVIYRPSLLRRFPQMADPPAIERMLAVLEDAEVVEPDEKISVCRDPADDKFFACALAGDANYIVSEDKDILAVNDFRGVKTISADEYMRLLEEG